MKCLHDGARPQCYRCYLSSRLSQIGTNNNFICWLSHRHLTLTAYRKLPLPMKLALQKSYAE